MLHGEHFSGAAHAALDFVGNKEYPVLFTKGGHFLEIAVGWRNEASFSLHRFRYDGGHTFRIDAGDEKLFQGIDVPKGGPVNFRGKGAEFPLVGFYLGGHGHGEGGAAMVGVLKHDNGRATSVIPGNFYGVFNGFRTGVDEQGLFGEVARSELAQLVRQSNGRVIGVDHETGVGEFFRLLFDGCHHLGMAVAHIHDGDTAGKVNVLPSFHILDDGTFCRRDIAGGPAGVSVGNYFGPQIMNFLVGLHLFSPVKICVRG